MKQGIVVLAFGPQGVDFFKKVEKLVGKDGVLGTQLARMLGANITAGDPELINMLMKKLEPVTLAETAAKHANSGLSPEAIKWLASGERGTSSETLFTFATGVDALGDDRGCWPLDPDDFRRCRLLVESCPEVAANMGRVAEHGPTWKAIVERWDAICAVMDKESPEWRVARGSAPRTYELLHSIIKSSGGEE